MRQIIPLGFHPKLVLDSLVYYSDCEARES
jgi:hypothetical protein